MDIVFNGKFSDDSEINIRLENAKIRPQLKEVVDLSDCISHSTAKSL